MDAKTASAVVALPNLINAISDFHDPSIELSTVARSASLNPRSIHGDLLLNDASTS
jgi:hypothetical protein